MRESWIEYIQENTPRLTPDNFIEQIVSFGYFTEQFPSCFSSEMFASKLDELLPTISSCKNSQTKNASMKSTLPTTFSVRKNDISRRTLSLPNPQAFLRLVKLMQENWDDIQCYAKSDFSLSPITYIHKYKDSREKAKINSENVRESLSSKSDYIEGIRNRIQASIGYKYRLSTDIANCYNSIYTHSIAWAICGKSQAKKYMRTKEPQSLKKKYDLANRLDTFIRFQKNNETNGIVVGPFSSRIFSEIILAGIDKKLKSEGYVFRRYVDDYKFYFRSEIEAKGNVPNIERVLNEYGLNLNLSKTKIDSYPFEVISQMQETYEKSISKKGVFGVLNSASILYLNGEKGAYKYALKFIKDHEPLHQDVDVIMSSLISILIIEPKHGKYVLQYLIKHIDKWKRSNISELINCELKICIKDKLHQETLVFLHLVKELKLSLRGDNLFNILCCSNDFAIIIALDIWKNRNDLVKRSRKEATEINNAIKKLSTELMGEKYSGARWLLIFEIISHNLMSKDLIPNPTNDDFFQVLHKNHVTFYQSIIDSR